MISACPREVSQNGMWRMMAQHKNSRAWGANVPLPRSNTPSIPRYSTAITVPYGKTASPKMKLSDSRRDQSSNSGLTVTVQPSP